MRFDPCLPPSWDTVRVTRPWRGVTLDVTVVRDETLALGAVQVEVDGRALEGTLLPPPAVGATKKGTMKVEVRYRVA